MIYIFWMFETVIGIWTWKHELAEERKIHPEKFETEENEKEAQQEVTSFDEEKDIELRTGSLIGVIVGETLHKFVDGLAMGVSWAVGWKVGKVQKIKKKPGSYFSILRYFYSIVTCCQYLK